MRFTLFLLGAVLLSSQAQAFDAKKFHISYFQETESDRTSFGSHDNKIITFRQASFRYALSDSWSARIDLREETTDAIVGVDEHDRSDPRIGVQAITYKNDTFSIFTQFLADVHQGGTGKIIRPRIYNAINFEFAKTHSLAIAYAIRRWIYESGKDDKYGLQVDGFTEITYRVILSDLITLQAYYDAAINSRKAHSSTDLVHSDGNIDLGVEFNFKNVGSFMPYIGYNFQDGKTHDDELEDLSLGFTLSTRFF